MTDLNVYRGRVAVVTGGASGIGAAIGKQLAREGAQVVLADRQRDLAESVAASIRSSGGDAIALELDVRDMAAMTRVVDETLARWGSVDYFFNNAGIGVGGEVEHYEPRDWDDVFDVNVRGIAYGIQAVYPVMIRQGSGHIVNTASIAGLIAAPVQIGYTASKHAVVGLSKALRVEAKVHNVRVSVLCPGAIQTPILTGGKYGRINTEGLNDEALLKMWERLRPLDADAFARKVLSAVARNESIIVVPAWWKLLWFIDRLSPALGLLVSELTFARVRADLEAAGARPPARHPQLRVVEDGGMGTSKLVH